MASVLSLLFLLNSLFFVVSSSSSSTQQQQLLLPLTHTHKHTRSPTHHLLKYSSLRSANRHRRKHHQQVSLPLAAGSDYTLTLSVGPATSVDLYMDTGSDLVWFPCSPFKCILCDGKSQSPSSPPPPPPNSSLVSCSDPSCSAAHSSSSSSSSSDLCSMANCPLEDIETSSCAADRYHCPRFYYAYGDGSLIAHLRRGPLSLNSLSVPNFTFACAHSALAEPVGVAGFGRGILSLPNQLTPSLGATFSYCFISHSFQQATLIKPSPLILGRSLVQAQAQAQANSSFPYQTNPFIYTPMLRNPKYPYFYSVALLAISVGNTTIPAESNLIRVDRDGNGGMVVDSGTTFTMLPTRLYSKVTAQFSARMDSSGFERAEKAEAETGLRPCYYYSGRNDSRAVPGMGLHFAGNASVELPRGNYFMGFDFKRGERGGGGGVERVGCLMVMDGGDEAGGPAGTLGNFQQQGFEVVYDLEVGRVGFARRRCASLWDEMSRGG